MKATRSLAIGLALVLVLSGCSSLAKPVEPVTSTPEASSTASTGTVTHTSPDRQKLAVPDVKPDGFVDPPAGSGMARYQNQKISWSTCGELECAKVIVPLDYAKPDGQAITLALSRRRSTTTPRIGTLFINPGGPGGSGQSYVSSYQATGLGGFDIIGWDPRGSGESTPVKCFSDAEADKYLALDASPDNEQENQALLDATKKYAQSCLANSGALLSHISTQDTARDLDLLRQLVGDKQLYYDGVSYGTFIGATYAQMFPKNVGRLVLDGAVNITEDTSVIQSMGFDTALENFATWCAGQQSCNWGNSVEAVKKTLSTWLDKLDQQPVQVGDRELTQTLATLGIALYLYFDESVYPQLVKVVNAAMSGEGAALLWAGDQLNGREDSGHYGSLFHSFSAILCADTPDDGVAAAYKEWKSDEKKAPFFAKYMGVGYVCPVWTAAPAPKLTLTGKGAAPIMVIGGTGDSATPYKQAQWMANQLDSGFLLTFDGAGHGAYGGKSTCIDNAVVAYLTKGTVTPSGKVCRPN